MKKVSFVKGQPYSATEVEYLPEDVCNEYLKNADYREGEDFHITEYICLESFTAEITVKIMPYESN